VLGSARYPFPGTTDFSAFLLRARASRDQVVALACGGADMINAVKQAAEFGLTRRGQRVAALLMFISDGHALGLDAAQGSVCSETFYWDLNDRARAFSSSMRSNQGMGAPTMVHAGCHALALHYLEAAAGDPPFGSPTSGCLRFCLPHMTPMGRMGSPSRADRHGGPCPVQLRQDLASGQSARGTGRGRVRPPCG
jgi:hypothetical protein